MESRNLETSSEGVVGVTPSVKFRVLACVDTNFYLGQGEKTYSSANIARL